MIARLRALFKKKGPGKQTLDLNEAIQEIIALTGSELNKGRVALRFELVGGSSQPHYRLSSKPSPIAASRIAMGRDHSDHAA